MLDELEPYLLSPELFWPLSTPNSVMPQDRLTLGNLILSFDQLDAVRQTLAAGSKARLRALELEWESATVKWKSAISQKASAEISSRLNLWNAYLTDLNDGHGDKFDFQREVRNRVIIERLIPHILEPDAWQVDLQASDGLLRSLVTPGEFVWPEELQSEYPRAQYWFLYRTPRKPE